MGFLLLIIISLEWEIHLQSLNYFFTVKIKKNNTYFPFSLPLINEHFIDLSKIKIVNIFKGSSDDDQIILT